MTGFALVEGIPTTGIPDGLDNLGVVGLCILIVVALARGWLVTSRELARAHHDRDEWRAESRIKDQQLAVKDEQLGHLAEVGRTVEQLARGLQQEMP